MDTSMDNPWNFCQSNLRSYKPRNRREHVTRSKNDPFICELHSPEKYKCKKCSFKSDLKLLLTKHFGTVHKTRATEHDPTPVLRYCAKCGFQTHSSLVLLSHDYTCARNGYIKVKSVHDLCGNLKKPLEHEEEKTLDSHPNRAKILPFQCEHCPYRTPRRKCFRVHLRSMHPSSDQSIWYRCERCSHKTKHMGHMNLHLERHNLSSARQPKTLTHNAAARLPANVEREEEKGLPKRFECVHCLYTSVRRDSVKVHLRTVHPSLAQRYWFRCEHCSYKSNHKGHLNLHLFRHHTKTGSQKRPANFKCEQCSYENINILNVRLHMERVHTPTEQKK